MGIGEVEQSYISLFPSFITMKIVKGFFFSDIKIKLFQIFQRGKDKRTDLRRIKKNNHSRKEHTMRNR